MDQVVLLGLGERWFGGLGGDAFTRLIGHTLRRSNLQGGSAVQGDTVGPELAPISQLLVDGAGCQLSGAMKPIDNLLVGGAAILFERSQTESQQNDARQNDRYGKTSQHTSNSNPRRYTPTSRFVQGVRFLSCGQDAIPDAILPH